MFNQLQQKFSPAAGWVSKKIEPFRNWVANQEAETLSAYIILVIGLALIAIVMSVARADTLDATQGVADTLTPTTVQMAQGQRVCDIYVPSETSLDLDRLKATAERFGCTVYHGVIPHDNPRSDANSSGKSHTGDS